ncbi:expansin EXLX1 family cellulose-binding protein [Streptomyces sp. NPDC090106]|uniref:expansin EXLX1 family cellulose-binding protein n=1 Tax=Streptomyces sp. NPDC090106 TaxID=3365946 RepID=UPI00382E2979
MSSSHHRRRPRRGRAVAVSAVVAAVVLAAALVAALRDDDGGGGGTTVAGRPVAAPSSTAPPAPAPSEPASASPSASASASVSPSASRTAAPASGASKRPATTPTREAAAVPAGAPLAGRIVPGRTYQGVATFYDTADGDGACTFGPTDDTMTAAMNHTDYETSKACGAYVVVRAGGASVTVRITNECPECGPGDIDLSPQAFAKLAAPVTGRISVTWTLTSPADAGTLSLRYKTGSSAYWCGVQVLGHRNPVARLEVSSGGGWTALPRTEYDYFLSEQGTGCGGTIRITDIYGERLTVQALPVRPDTVQPTRVQFTRR